MILFYNSIVGRHEEKIQVENGNDKDPESTFEHNLASDEEKVVSTPTSDKHTTPSFESDSLSPGRQKRSCMRLLCRQHISTIGLYVRRRMAFKTDVTVDPRLYSARQKSVILMALALGASLNGFCSTVYFPGIPSIKSELNASEIEITLVSSLFILFGGLGPIFWASMSDYYFIRRFLYLAGLLIFIGASIGCAVANNIWLLIVLRCIQSIGTSVTMSVGAGTVADCWQITERGSAFSFLFVGQFLGPLIGPIVGGGVTSGAGWRSAFWLCTGYGTFLFLFFFFCFPETYRLDHYWDHEQILSKLQSQTTLVNDSHSKLVPPHLPSLLSQSAPGSSSSSLMQQDNIGHQTKDGKRMVPSEDVSDDGGHQAIVTPTASTSSTTRHDSSYRIPTRSFNPFKSFSMMQYIFVCFVAVEIGFCFGTMFTLETLIPDIYYVHYGFNSWQTGLSFLGAGIGNVLGSLVSGRLSDYLLKRSSQKRGGIYKAEDRLTLNAWPGGFFLIPLGVLLFGWSIMARFSVWPAIIGFSILCFGMSQVYTAGSAYLVDAIPGKGASVTAACNFFRMTMAAILSMVSPIMGSALSIGYVSVLLASLNVIGMCLLVYIKFKGIHLRRSAGFASKKV
ncbi:MAG: major facilitator superfamily domain-containing protein [Benjaminiella poitrasii]|nr:MAG: major facilitator superfamily domain-containing protein [Benjaminiella poitrasii]